MTATSTRLLVLGAASIFQPVNGYQLRRELLSWGVADWAHIKPGSIYSVLATMARQGFLERHELADGSRPVAVYTVTETGDAERERLFRECLQTVDLQSPLPFYTAVAVLPLLSREAFAGHRAVTAAVLLRVRRRRHRRRALPAQPYAGVLTVRTRAVSLVASAALAMLRCIAPNTRPWKGHTAAQYACPAAPRG